MTAPERVEPDVEVRAYAREVRAALADVPADRLAELLDDLEDHLVEVAAEGGEPQLRGAAGTTGPARPAASRSSAA